MNSKSTPSNHPTSISSPSPTKQARHAPAIQMFNTSNIPIAKFIEHFPRNNPNHQLIQSSVISLTNSSSKGRESRNKCRAAKQCTYIWLATKTKNPRNWNLQREQVIRQGSERDSYRRTGETELEIVGGESVVLLSLFLFNLQFFTAVLLLPILSERLFGFHELDHLANRKIVDCSQTGSADSCLVSGFIFKPNFDLNLCFSFCCGIELNKCLSWL